jgi:hypothetical protein
VASFILRALPQAIPPSDLMKSSMSAGPERARRSTPALGLQRLVAQEVFVVFRPMVFEILNSMPHRVAIVQLVVKFLTEKAGTKSEHITMGRFAKMSAVKARNTHAFSFDLGHESHNEWNRQTLGKAEFHFDDQILIDGNSEKSGEAFSHIYTRLKCQIVMFDI